MHELRLSDQNRLISDDRGPRVRGALETTGKSGATYELRLDSSASLLMHSLCGRHIVGIDLVSSLQVKTHG